MGLNDTLKCPGMDKTLSTFPIEFDCLQCNGTVEIWSDEVKRRCTKCGTMVFNPYPSIKIPDDKTPQQAAGKSNESIDELLRLALDLGASDVTTIDSSNIQIDNQLADLCRETKCPNYGSSPTCPPHVKGPDWLKRYIHKISLVILVEIEALQELMYSDKRKEIGKLLHFIVIEIEKAAQEKGLIHSIAFAGGSCKSIQCSEYPYCKVLNGNGTCRNPDMSRPSVSGVGINMNHLLNNAGWVKKRKNFSAASSSNYGLVFIG